MNEFFFLGPVILKNRNKPFKIPRRQVRALLYRLGVRLEKVPRDSLANMFWPDQPDATARRNLSHLIAHLNRALPDPELLQNSRDYLQLDRNKIWTDTEQFLQLSNFFEGDPDIISLSKAVELYRSPLLSGFSLPGSSQFEEWLLFERQYFELQYLKILNSLIVIWSNEHNYQKAIVSAKKYLSVNELAEDIHKQLMILYAASGDRKSALRQFEICATVLERELGIKPLNETRSIYQSILQDQVPYNKGFIQKQIWLDLPNQEIPLVGRQEILSKFGEVIQNLKLGRGGILLLSGEAGIGKTRLIHDFAIIFEKDVKVISGMCQMQNKTLPYQPIVQALRSIKNIEELKIAVPSIWIGELTRLLPELKSAFQEEPDQPVEPGEARLRLFEALVQVFLGLAKTNGPLVLCIDDLHLADNTTLDWLVYLSKRILQSHLLVLATYRSEDNDAVVDMKLALNRAGVLFEVKLQGLNNFATQEIVSHFLDSDQKMGSFSERLQQSTKGNPFLIIETLRTLKESGKFEQNYENIEMLPLPESICHAVEERLRRLDPISRQILEAAAIMGESFTFDMIHLHSGRSEIEASDGLEVLTTRQFIILNPQHGTYSFQHDLIRRAVKENLNPIRRQLLHRRAGWVLEQLGSNLVELMAYHFDLGGENLKAIYYHELAVKRAENIFAWHEVEFHQDRLLTILERTDPSNSSEDILLKQIQILIDRAHQSHLLGNLRRRNNALAIINELANKSGNPDLLIQSSLHKTTFLNLDAEYEAAIAEAHKALDITNPSGNQITKVSLMNQIGFSHYFLGEPHQALSILKPALSQLNGDDIETRRHLTHTMGYAYFHMGEYERSLQLQEETYNNHQKIGDKNGMAWAGLDIGASYLKLGRQNEAKEYLTTNLDLAGKIGSRSAEAYGLSWLGYWEIIQGNYYNALQLFHKALSLELVLHSTHGRVAAEEGIGLAYYHLSDLIQARHWLKIAIEHAQPIGHIRRFIIALTGLGLVELLEGNLGSSRIQLQDAINAAQSSDCKEGLSRGLSALARVCRLSGDKEAALKNAFRAIKIAKNPNLPSCEIFGQIEAGLALLAKGKPKAALEHTQKAVTLISFAGEAWLGSEEIYHTHSIVLRALGNITAAEECFQQANDGIFAKAKKIPDINLQQKYLQSHKLD